MKLQINTNGAWRTVLSGLGGGDDPKYGADALRDAKQAAATLARIHAAQARNKPHSWRLVSENGGNVLEHCCGDAGWQQIYQPSQVELI